MSSNPYESPVQPQVVGVITGQREDLYKVAKYQRGLIGCIAATILLWIASISLQVAMGASDPGAGPQIGRLVAQLFIVVAFLTVAVVSTIYVFALSMKVYGTGVGIVLGILTFIPCIGLFVLLIVNGKATSVLQLNGIPVGFLGADMSRFGNV